MKEKFITIYQELCDSVFRYCYFRISDRNIALDITQETFTKYWDVMLSGQIINNDKALVFKISRNLIIDYYRKKKSVSLEALIETENGESFEEFSLIRDNGKNEIEMEIEARFLMNKIYDLPKSYQQIMYLRYIEDMDPEHIAEIMGVSVNAASVKIHRGVKELKKITGY